MSANCGSRKTRRSVSKVEIISLALRWLRSAIKTRESLKMRLPRPKTRKKRTFTRIARRLITAKKTGVSNR